MACETAACPRFASSLDANLGITLAKTHVSYPTLSPLFGMTGKTISSSGVKFPAVPKLTKDIPDDL